MGSRFVDPRRHIERATEEAHGLLTARELSHQIDTGNRIDAELNRNQKIISFETVEFHCPNPVANSLGVQAAHLIATGAGSYTLSLVSGKVEQQCRITHVRLIASTGLSAGTITPVFTITEGINTTIVRVDECEMDSSTSLNVGVRLEWSVAPQLAKGAIYIPALETSAAYAPTTNDYKLIVSFGYGDWD